MPLGNAIKCKFPPAALIRLSARASVLFVADKKGPADVPAAASTLKGQPEPPGPGHTKAFLANAREKRGLTPEWGGWRSRTQRGMEKPELRVSAVPAHGQR